MKQLHWFARLATLGLGIVLAANGASGRETAKSAKQQFIGTWTLVSIHYIGTDGKRIEPFGPGAAGMLYFDATGHFATQAMAANRRPFAASNRMLGTADENRATAQGVVAYFGTYSVDDTNHILTLHIEMSSFPNWNGTDQKRTFVFEGDELRYTAANSTANPAESAELIWKRVR